MENYIIIRCMEETGFNPASMNRIWNHYENYNTMYKLLSHFYKPHYFDKVRERYLKKFSFELFFFNFIFG